MNDSTLKQSKSDVKSRPNLNLIVSNAVLNTNISFKLRVFLFLKRAFDLFCATIAFIILLPIFLIVIITIKLDSKGPAIYHQERVGKNGKLFKIYKFRSMCQNADELKEQLLKLNERDGPVFKITNDPRVTRVGKFLRRSSMDELPQLINIIRGDMSIVGPRPALPNEVNTYTEEQKQRLSVTPGLTCYWQIFHNANTTFDEWVEMDVKYIKNRSVSTDLKLIFKTIIFVFRRKNH